MCVLEFLLPQLMLSALTELVLKIVTSTTTTTTTSEIFPDASSACQPMNVASLPAEKEKKEERIEPAEASPSPDFLCPDCEVIWPDEATLLRHQSEECLAGVVTRLTQSRAYWQRRLAQRKSGRSHSNYCCACRQTLNNGAAFVRHVEEIHLRICSSESPLADFLPDDAEGHHPLSADELRHYAHLVKVQSGGGIRRFSCRACGITAMPATAFAKHISLLHLGLDVWATLDPK
jgi:hypothetical protein